MDSLLLMLCTTGHRKLLSHAMTLFREVCWTICLEEYIFIPKPGTEEQVYRIEINEEGAEALKYCLPKALYDKYVSSNSIVFVFCFTNELSFSFT